MRSHRTAGLALAAIALAASSSFAQVLTFYEWLPTDAQDWNTDANWLANELNFVPDTDLFAGESARINTGGSAIVTGDVPRVGQIEALNGAIDIQGGGQLDTSPDMTSGASGLLTIGGAGAINLSGNGQLTVGGNVNNSGTVQVTGPSASFTVASNFLSSGGTLSAGITDANNHSVISVTGEASLGGTLNVDFSNGVTPSAGDTWDLVDAADISGGYQNVNATGSLPSGLGLFYQTQAGGSNGVLGQVTADAQLVLEVNRRTGATSIVNPYAGGAAQIDGYLIESAADSLVPAGWTSYNDSGNTDWTESNPGTNSIGELNLTGSSSVAADSSFDLGAIYEFTPTEIAQTAPGLVFEYHVPNGGTRTGLVEFEGLHNNLVLLVDPVTGEAAIQNQSIFDINLDGYLVTSDSSSLDTGWDSLATTLGSGWTESNPASNHLGELNLDGSLFLSGGSLPISLGDLFNVGGTQDLEFEFHLDGGDTITGVVEYGEFSVEPPFLPGDYNVDGVVDAADYSVYRDNLGLDSAALNGRGSGGPIVGPADYALWVASYGSVASSSIATAVPEPAALSVLALAGALAFGSRRTA